MKSLHALPKHVDNLAYLDDYIDSKNVEKKKRKNRGI